MDSKRFMALTWVKCHIIQGLRSVGAGETDWERKCWRLCGHPDFPVHGLHRKAVEHMIVELYAATTAEVKAELRAQISTGGLLHLNLDVWVDKFSSLKCVGERRSRAFPARMHRVPALTAVADALVVTPKYAGSPTSDEPRPRSQTPPAQARACFTSPGNGN